MDDFLDDELKQMEERESLQENTIVEAIALSDPIESLSKGCLSLPEDTSLREVVNRFQKENIGSVRAPIIFLWKNLSSKGTL